MKADVGSAVGCSDSYDFCIVGVDEAVAALRYTPAFACVVLILQCKYLALKVPFPSISHGFVLQPMVGCCVI